MPTELRSRTPRARKTHRCHYCTGPIGAGTVYHRTTLIYDWINCCDCDRLVSTVWRWTEPVQDEGIGRDDFVEWAEAHRDDGEHGESARAFLARALAVSGDGDPR